MSGSNESFTPTLTEQLTTNFYIWETRGRGWQVWDCPVELEPPYEPFFHYISQLPQQKVIDDGRKHTFLSSLTERFLKSLKGPPEIEVTPTVEQDIYYDLEPLPSTDTSDIKEIRISLPPKQRINIDNAEQFLLNLSYCSSPLSFEVIGTSDSIIVQLTCRESDILQVRQQIQAYFPEAAISEESNFLRNIWDIEAETVVVDFGLSHEFMRPLRTFRNFDTDPLIGIIGALEYLDQGEIGVFQVLFQAALHPWTESIIRSVTDYEGKPFFADAPEMIQLAREKVRRPLFAAVIRVAGQSPLSHRPWEIVRAVGSGLTQLSYPQSNELIPLSNEEYDNFIHQENVLSRQSHRCGMLLNSEELVSIVHPPSVSVQAKKLLRELKKTKTAPSIAIGHQLILGENVHQGKATMVSLSPEQRLRHMYIIGATGTGKSTLLLNLIIQDINNGLGLTVLDPHGDLIDRIIEHIPAERFDDVILLDPSDADYPVGLNILSAHSEIEKNLLSSDLVSVFKRLSTSWGDQMTSVLGNAILAFLESDEGGTLVDLRRFLVEADFRRSFLQKVKDPEIVYYWQKEFPLLSGKPQSPILTRLDTFLRPKLIRHMVAQKEGLNFEDILNTKKIFLAKLAQGLIGEENAYLLGTLIVSKIQQAAMARQAKDITEREPVYCYIDEFHNLITPSITALLSGARKYHLGLILAHQELRQLWNRDTEVANSVISNPGTRICFRLGDFDAQKLEDGFSSFDAFDLQNLGVGETIARVERTEYDFNLKVLAPPEVSPELAKDRQERIISLSRQTYGTPREKIEKSLAKGKPIIEITPEEIKKPEKIEKEAPIKKEKPKVEIPITKEKDISQHRYLQALIKKMAEEKGYKAVIEKPTPDGQGKVDVSLEKNGKKIACEVSLTTTDEQELKNIEKCLAAGYEKVILCSPEKKNLEKVKDLVSQKLKDADKEKVLFLQPEEMYFYLEEESAKDAGKEERVKGYRVKVKYQPVKETEKKKKREAVAQVVLQAMKRMKGK
ncbi:MAG: type IV secretion system DNA-binding domain-containing protein [Patescibacteria group bacterium]